MAAADLEELLHPSGETSARFLVLALAVTPLTLLAPSSKLLVWLRKQRRAIGLAAFGYATLHLLFYLFALGDVAVILDELGLTGIWTGWVALALLVPLAVTSNDASMRALRRNWKRLQRLVYPAALLTLFHWIAVHGDFAAALAHFVPLAILEALRIFRQYNPVAGTA